MDSVLIAIVVVAAAVVLWRLIRGAHSWAQVGLFGVALLSGMLAGNALLSIGAPLEDVVYSALAGTFGYLGYFGLRRSEPVAPPPRPASERTEQDRTLERIQSALMLLVVAASVVIPILWIKGDVLTGVVPWLIVYAAVGLPFFGLLFAAHRVTLGPVANPYDRRGRGFFARGFRWIKRELASMARRLPLFARPSRRRADSAR